MRKTKHLFLALLAVTGLSTAWASDLPGNDPDSVAAKTSFTVQWTGNNNVVYNGQQQNVLTATYVDPSDASIHNLSLTFTSEDGSVVLTAPEYPVHAGTWTVEATTPQTGVTLDNAVKTLNIAPATVRVVNASAKTYKFYDGTNAAERINAGTLEVINSLNQVIHVGPWGNDQVSPITTAVFDNSNVGTDKTITLHFGLTDYSDYTLDSTQKFYTNKGVILERIAPNPSVPATEDIAPQNGLELSAHGYCTGNGYTINYHLISGNPDQYRVHFNDSRFTDVDWTWLPVTGLNGTISINLPNVILPTGDYVMSVYFRDSRYPDIESNPIAVSIHINLPPTYTMPLFDNVIALVDTCNCFSDIQWYHSTDGGATWTAIPGANGYYYREEGGLTGQYYVSAKMNGVQTYTCPQTDVTTLITDDSQGAKVAAYPNPTTEDVSITISGSDTFSHTLRVISTLGSEMECRTFEGNSTTIDMRGYHRGNYIVNVDGLVVRVIKK